MTDHSPADLGNHRQHRRRQAGGNLLVAARLCPC